MLHEYRAIIFLFYSSYKTIKLIFVCLQLCEDMDATAGRLGLKKTTSNTEEPVTVDDANESEDVNPDNNDEPNNDNETSAATNAETSFPRRSLRKQGIGPLEDGLPYYESVRTYKRRVSATDDKSDEDSIEQPVNNSECHDSEGEGDNDKDMTIDVDTEHNLSSEATLNTSSVTGKCQSFMVKNLLDLKSPQDSIPPVNFSTPTHSVATNGPVIPNGFPNEAINTSTNSNTSLQRSTTKRSNITHSSLHTSDLVETTTSNHITQELPIVSKHQLKHIFHYAVQNTDKTTVSHLEKLHNCLEHAIFRHRMEKNKNTLLEVSINQCA